MSFRYVLNSLKRRKLRALVIVLALTIGVALVGALLALVDTQAQFSLQSLGSQTGGFDLRITRSDLADSTFFPIDDVAALAASAYQETAAVHPRIQVGVEARKEGAIQGEALTVVAVDFAADSLVSVEQNTAQASGGVSIAGIRIGGGSGAGGAAQRRMRPAEGAPPGGGFPGGGAPSDAAMSQAGSRRMAFSQSLFGVYPPQAGQIFLDSAVAGNLGVRVGDELLLSYAIPAPREPGKPAITGVSAPRVEAVFLVAGIGALTGLGNNASNPAVMNLSDAQAWLGQSGRANQLLLVWQAANKASTDARATVTQARAVGEQVRAAIQSALGADYEVSLPKYTNLENASQAYVFTQIFITLYGILSMGIIGLMVNALMTTTVAEQQHDLAVLRVIGAPRARLFQIVIVEVFVLGAVSVVLGLLLGRAINDYVIVPVVLANLNLPAGVRAEWTLQTALIPTAITAGVLALATISPARAAAATKVMVVLNPAAADQPTLEDLARLRERRADGGLLIAGLALLAFSAVILIALPTIFTRGNFTGQVVLQFSALLLMVVGIALLFYFLTTPLERLLIALYQALNARAAFFAGRYALRGKGRNALISLMVVMSGVLPCLLATQLALQDANLETDSRFNNGAPMVAQASVSMGGFPIFRRFGREETELSDEDVAAVVGQPGLQTVVGVAANLSDMTVGDQISLRTARVSLIGVGGDLNAVLYPDLFRWTEGDAAALTRILTDPNAAIISEGLSAALDLHVGDPLRVVGKGVDHARLLTIVGVAARVPGFSSYFSRNSSDANGSGVFIHLDAYRDLANDPADGPYDPDKPVLTRLFATLQPGVSETAVLRELRQYLSGANSMSVTATSEQVAQARAQLQQGRVFIVLLTLLSMVTAVFGVTAVMYTAVTARRLEIGMLKAIGSAKGVLRGAFIGEAVITTLAAGLAGILAGTLLGYIFVITQRIQNDQPFLLAFDFNTAGLIVALVCLAAIFSGALATQPVIRQKAVTILRER